MEFIPLAAPRSESELVLIESILNAHDIAHYVLNRGFGGLYPGMQVPLINMRRVMVVADRLGDAVELLAAFQIDQPAASLHDTLRFTDKLRVVFELLLGHWAVPCRRRYFEGGEIEHDEAYRD